MKARRFRLKNMPYPSHEGFARKMSATKLGRYCGGAILFLALQLPIVLPGAPSFAQAAGPAVPSRQTRSLRRRPTIDDVVKRFAKNLDLNEAQEAAVKKILEQRQSETLRIRQDSSISGGARIDQFRALQDRTVERIRAVLNDEQRKKYDPLASRRVKLAPDQKSVEDWLKLTTPK
jgi:hypothetical protein